MSILFINVNIKTHSKDEFCDCSLITESEGSSHFFATSEFEVYLSVKIFLSLLDRERTYS